MKKTRSLTINAILISILLTMSLVPFLGFIQIGPVAIVLTHIPVIIGAIALGPFSGFVLGLTFGIGSWLAAVLRAATPIDLLFVNPVIAILPRVLFGLAVAILWKLLTHYSDKNKISKVSLSAFLGTLVHTFMVLSLLYFAMKNDASLSALTEGGLWLFLVSTFSLNAIIEALLAVYFSVAILKALRVIPNVENKNTQVPKVIVNVNQGWIIVSILLTWFLKEPVYLLLSIVVLGLGVFFNENPVMALSSYFLRKPYDQYTLVDGKGERFAQSILLFLLSMAFLASIFKWSPLGNIALTVALCFAGASLLGVCIGDYLLNQWLIYKGKGKNE